GRLDGPAMAKIAGARNGNGRLELIGIDNGGPPWRRAELTAGSDVWEAWAPLPSRLCRSGRWRLTRLIIGCKSMRWTTWAISGSRRRTRLIEVVHAMGAGRWSAAAIAVRSRDRCARVLSESR